MNLSRYTRFSVLRWRRNIWSGQLILQNSWGLTSEPRVDSRSDPTPDDRDRNANWFSEVARLAKWLGVLGGIAFGS
jgi:hypothetical protein